MSRLKDAGLVVPYIGTWIETSVPPSDVAGPIVVPYIGTWIETVSEMWNNYLYGSYLI